MRRKLPSTEVKRCDFGIQNGRRAAIFDPITIICERTRGPPKRYPHVKYEYGAHYRSRDMLRQKSGTDGRTDKRTNGRTNGRTTQKLYAPFRLAGHNNFFIVCLTWKCVVLQGIPVEKLHFNH